MHSLKVFRKVNGITQNDLALYLGTTKGFISQVENGLSKFPIPMLNKLYNNDKGWETTHLPKMDKSQTPLQSEETLFDEATPEETPNIGTMINSIHSLCESIKSLVEMSKEEGRRTDKILEILQRELDKK